MTYLKIMDNKLMTLDGLIERLTELRELAGKDCPIVLGKSFDPQKERMKFTMVSLDSYPKSGKHYVAFLAEDLPRLPHFVCKERKEDFDSAFIIFEKQNPDWKECLTDSTYYELAEWYDEFIGVSNNESLSDKAHEFAAYVWRKLNLV